MWEGGPLREWSGADKRPSSHFIPYNRGGYVGSYVCERCRMTCDGVYEARNAHATTEWLCGGCKEGVTTKQEQPAQLRRAHTVSAAAGT